MIQKELLKMPVSDLVPYENNPRVISPAAVDACAESIKQCSALDPIEVDENNVILSGHTRRLALMQLNVDMADVVRYTGLTAQAALGHGACCLLRGVRGVADFEYERNMAEVNRQLFGIDTVLLFADPRLSSVSSSMVRELEHFGYDTSRFVIKP